MMKTTIFYLLIISTLYSCSIGKYQESEYDCDEEAVIDISQFTNASEDLFTIIDLEIIDDCLKVHYSASGCSGETWDLKLIDSEAILESNPPQRNLKLSLMNEEMCLAVFTKEISFDISNLQVNGNSVQLNIVNSSTHILYEY